MNQNQIKILFLTKGGIEVPTNRLWFFNMSEYLKDFGFDTYVNDYSQNSYDIIFINRLARYDLIYEALKHSPKAHIGVFFGSTRIDESVAANVDFFFSYSFLFHEMLLPLQKRIYDSHDYFETKAKKIHTKSNNLIIGYHGNEIHYQRDFFPNGAKAVSRLAQKYDFEFHVLIKDSHQQPSIPGVKMKFFEWELNTHEEILSHFDIGIVPALASMKQMGEPFSYLRNPNRVNLLLSMGIPSVTSPIPEVVNQFKHNKNTIFAVSEAGWYDGIERLITNPAYREQVSTEGYQLFKENFSQEVIVANFAKQLKKEFSEPIFNKPWLENNTIEAEFKRNKRKYKIQYIKTIPKQVINKIKSLIRG